MALSPNMPLFQRVAYNRPSDSGGGTPQDSYLHVTRFDYILNDKTQIYGRYGLQSNNLFPGSNASSPYQGFDTGSEQFNNTGLVSMVHTFSPRTVAQSKLSFDRLNNLQPLGQNRSGPTLYFLGNQTTSILGTNVALPGYLPFSPGNAIPFGGPRTSYRRNRTSPILAERTLSGSEEPTSTSGIIGSLEPFKRAWRHSGPRLGPGWTI
jgi:hypothetical protein